MSKLVRARARALSVAALRVGAVIAVLGIAACGGGGGGGTPPPKLFAADSTNQAIGSINNSNPSPGPIVVDRIIIGLATGLSTNIGGLALDTVNNRIYVGNGTSILVFNNASTATGNVSPARTVTTGGSSGQVFLDTANNLLYVADDANGVRVFNNPGTIDGANTGDRLITGDFGTTFEIRGVAVDTTSKNILYVSNDTTSPTTSHQISVFDGAKTVNGSNTPNRTITPTVAGPTNLPVRGIFLDAMHDRLYVAGGSASTLVMIFDNASTANGAIAPTKSLGFPSGIRTVVVDVANDRLFAVGVSGLYILNGVSTVTNASTAVAILPVNGGSFTAAAVGL
jgi:hypothetical protein